MWSANISFEKTTKDKALMSWFFGEKNIKIQGAEVSCVEEECDVAEEEGEQG